VDKIAKKNNISSENIRQLTIISNNELFLQNLPFYLYKIN